MLGRIIASSAATARLATGQVPRRGFRHSSWVVGMPRNRISNGERFLHLLLITVGIYTVPLYILCHVKEYSK